ncbi:hypothetical protein JMJ35_008570 [Cladonia borealis]|uniref:Uncharacterized protein n=1 Tax=Cladonia borealis TaxID=184061 RepID=A0AA39QVN5_9LECA|nr:hypothetical protein JMJ35_008570 [Cladonia borealis]
MAPSIPPATSIQRDTSVTPISENPKPIPTSFSRPHSSSVLLPPQGRSPGKPSPSLSAPPPQTHSISSRNQAIGASVGSAAALGLLIVLLLLLRRYCRRGASNEPSNRIDKGKQRDDEAHPGMKRLTFEQRRKAEEAHPKKYSNRARESRTGEGIMMVRPTQTERRDFGSQFSPSLESQLQRTGTEDQEAVAGEDEAEAEAAGPSQRRPTVPDRAISSFMLPSPIVSVAETAAAFQSGDARIVCLTPPSDGGEVGRVVSLGDSCVIEALVRVMKDNDDEERRGGDEERRDDDAERTDDDDERRDDGDRIGIVVAQERREIDGVVVTVTDLGTRVVESAEEEESGGEGRVDRDAGWSPHDADLGDWVEDHPHLDGREVDSEDESDACSFKSMRDSVDEGEPEEGGKSGDDEQTEGARRDVGAAGGVENAPWVDTASAGSEGGASGYEADADP